MKHTAKAVNANQPGIQSFSANSSAANAVLAPRPMLLRASPRPGTQTAPRTVSIDGCGHAA